MTQDRYATQFESVRGPVTISGRLFKGHAAVCAMAPDCAVLLVGPSVDELQRAWVHLFPQTPIDVSRVQRVLVGAAENVGRPT